MSLDIKTITDAIAKKIAYDVDCENKMDGKLNKKEFSIFRTRATEAGVDTEVLNDLSDKFFAKGSNKADKADKADKKDDKKVDNKTKVDNNSDAGNDSDTTKLSLYQKGKYYGSIARDVREGLSKLTLENLVDTLTQKYSKNKEKLAVVADIQKMVEIINKMEIDSKEDIGKIKAELRKSKEFVAGTVDQDLVELVIQIAENDQIRKEGNELVEKYNTLLTNEANKGKTPEELIELTMKELEDKAKTSYYNNEAKKILKAHAQSLVGQEELQLIAKTPITDADKYLDGRTKVAHKDSKIGQAAVEDQTVAAIVQEAITNYNLRGETIDKVSSEELKKKHANLQP